MAKEISNNADLEKVIGDFRLFCGKHLKIKDKKGKIVPFILNRAQEVVLLVIERLIQLGLPIRLIVLKARQKGISTLIEAFIFWRTSYHRNRKAAVIAHENDATNNQLSMCNRYYTNLHPDLQVPKKWDNSKIIKYDQIESEVVFWSAEKGDVGSSHTLQDVHITEYSKWRDPVTTSTALFQCIPDEPNTMVVIESTANGFGDEFHNRWKLAKLRMGGAYIRSDIDIAKITAETRGYVPVFISWLIDNEYTLEFATLTERNNFENSLDDAEKNLILKGATLEHLKWRREIGLPDKCGNSADKFKQEYPSDDIEAFITSGRPVFDMNICNINYNKSTVPLKVGNLEPVYDYQNEKYIKQMRTDRTSYYDLLPWLTGVNFVENQFGYWKVFSEIDFKVGERYRFSSGSDVAEGLEQGDYSEIDVFDRSPMIYANKLDTCMKFHGHIDVDEFAVEHHKLQIYLHGDIYFAIERNNMGISTIVSAYKLGLNQYYNENFSKGYGQGTDLLGSRTTQDSKKQIINDLTQWIREGLFEDKDAEFWDQTMTFVKDSQGRCSAQNKLKNPGTSCFDDKVIAKALNIRCHQWMPPYSYHAPVHKPDWMKKLDKKAREGITAMGV